MQRNWKLLAVAAVLLAAGLGSALAARSGLVIHFGAVQHFVYRPGLLTVGYIPGVLVLESHPSDNDIVIVYRGERQRILDAYNREFREAGFRRIAWYPLLAEGVYARGLERVRLQVEPHGLDWQVHLTVTV